MNLPKVVSAQEWQVARDQLLEKEKEATAVLDALAAQRRRLPMVKFDEGYLFEGPDGKASLLDLFDGRRQLVVYQFMDNGPEDYCPGCSMLTDSVPRQEHLNARDTTYVIVSNMPLSQIESYKRRMEWTLPFYSSRGTTFSADCGADGGFGLNVFIRDGDDVYRTYFTSSRGADRLNWHFNILDLTPLGRQEQWEDSPEGWPQDPPYSWWRLHDQYAAKT